MQSITLAYRHLGHAVWTRVLESTAPTLASQRQRLLGDLAGMESLRARAQHNTGSISLASQWMLLSLTCFLRPTLAADIGTFIGKSAMAMAHGMDFAGQPGHVHTCDVSNGVDLPRLTQTSIVQYPFISSTQMFSEMLKGGLGSQVGLVHLDGRLAQGDSELLSQVCKPTGVLMIDDFEGVEKGVANVMALRGVQRFARCLLVPPPERDVLERFGLYDHCSTALLIAPELLKFSAQ